MRKYEIVIHGKPFAKQRPQVNNSTGSVYTPLKTINYEGRIANIFQTMYPEHRLIKNPVSLSILVFSERKRNDKYHNVKKPDVDNIAKIVMDGLNLIAWHDDAQVCSLRIAKYFSEKPRVEIKIREVLVNENS